MLDKVLFVDDEENILHSLKRMCHQENIDAYFFNNAAEALTQIKNGKFSVIITDMRMPEMNGVEFLKEVQIIDPDPIRIVLSGYGDIATAIKAINEGNVFKYLEKPIETSELINTIYAAASLYRDKKTQQEKLLRLGQFLCKVVHDIRSPLQGIKGSAEMLYEFCDDETAREFCEIIIDQSVQLNKLSSQLIHTHKDNRSHAKPEKFYLNDFLKKWTTLWRSSVSSRTIDIKVNTTEDYRIDIPANEISRVLNNLISNSLDIDKVSHIRVTISNNENGFLKITFLDNGGGIADNIQCKIFESYFTQGKAHGTGLGLATVKEIVEKYGGKIMVKNTDWEFGRGAEFSLALPFISP